MTDVKIAREFTAEHINSVLNNPEVRPWVSEVPDGPLDLTKGVDNHDNVLLMGEFGGCFAIKVLPGVYEIHTQILPEGRGAWAFEAVARMTDWIYTHTDAYELYTRIPKSHDGAKILAMKMGMRFDYTADTPVMFKGELTPVDIYSFRIQDWMSKVVHFKERGAWFHKIIGEQITSVGRTRPAHGVLENHNQYVGACLEMVINGQLLKGVTLYNRWAYTARHTQIEITSYSPPTIKFDVGFIELINGELKFEPLIAKESKVA